MGLVICRLLPSLDGPAKWMISHRVKPISPHHRRKSAPARIEHDQNAPDVPRACGIDEQQSFRRVEILRLRAVTVAVEKLYRHKRVKTIGISTWMEAQFLAQFRSCETTTGESGE
jgi:hypothetical protein